MLGRTPHEAWNRFENPLQQALGCIAPGRFIVRGLTAGLRAESDYIVTLNDMRLVPLKGPFSLRVVAGQVVRFLEERLERGRPRYRVLTVAYTYGFAFSDDRGDHELLTFHWNRDRVSPVLFPSGHLHIGRGLLANPTPIRPGAFHSAHIPTGYLDFPAIVRFAIVELGVAPLTPAWGSILAEAEALSERRS